MVRVFELDTEAVARAIIAILDYGERKRIEDARTELHNVKSDDVEE